MGAPECTRTRDASCTRHLHDGGTDGEGLPRGLHGWLHGDTLARPIAPLHRRHSHFASAVRQVAAEGFRPSSAPCVHTAGKTLQPACLRYPGALTV